MQQQLARRQVDHAALHQLPPAQAQARAQACDAACRDGLIAALHIQDAARRQVVLRGWRSDQLGRAQQQIAAGGQPACPRQNNVAAGRHAGLLRAVHAHATRPEGQVSTQRAEQQAACAGGCTGRNCLAAAVAQAQLLGAGRDLRRLGDGQGGRVETQRCQARAAEAGPSLEADVAVAAQLQAAALRQTLGLGGAQVQSGIVSRAAADDDAPGSDGQLVGLQAGRIGQSGLPCRFQTQARRSELGVRADHHTPARTRRYGRPRQRRAGGRQAQ